MEAEASKTLRRVSIGLLPGEFSESLRLRLSKTLDLSVDVWGEQFGVVFQQQSVLHQLLRGLCDRGGK